MSYEELSLKGFINEIIEVSSGPHPRKFCFVLGAGASRTSGVKSGQELVNIWDKELLERNKEAHLKWKQDLGITEENKYSFYSQYYERRFKRQPADGYNYLEKLMEHAKPSIGYVMLSYLLTQTNHNVVITTNFDHLVEDAVNYYTQTIPLIIGHEFLAHYISKQINRPTIVKIHRDLLFDPKNRTDELETLHDNWEKALGTIFSEYHPIFIGYAGNDKSLMNFLFKNSDKFMNNEWMFPYWMVYKTDEVSDSLSTFLDKSEGYLIRHGGFDEVLCLLGAAFEYKLPSKEDFLVDAEIRYQMISNSVDEFSGKSFQQEDITLGDGDNVAIESTEVNQAIQQIANQTELQRLYRETVTLSMEGKYAEALPIMEQLIQADMNNALYHFSLGVILQKLERYEEALRERKEAAKLEPDSAQYHNGVGVTLYGMKRYEEALVEVQKAVELESDNAKYHSNLGAVLNGLKRYEEAVYEKEKAIALLPDKASYHGSLADTLYEMERYEDALEEIKKAAKLEPDNEKYRESLKIIMEKIKEQKENKE